MQTVPDETMIVPGFEHHTFHCAACHDEERRLVFVREPKALSPPIQTPIQSEGMDQDFVDVSDNPVASLQPRTQLAGTRNGQVGGKCSRLTACLWHCPPTDLQ